MDPGHRRVDRQREGRSEGLMAEEARPAERRYSRPRLPKSRLRCIGQAACRPLKAWRGLHLQTKADAGHLAPALIVGVSFQSLDSRPLVQFDPTSQRASSGARGRAKPARLLVVKGTLGSCRKTRRPYHRPILFGFVLPVINH
jgi:hypothetical protein